MGLPPQASLRAIFNGTEVEEDKEVDVVGTCASFCDPDTYPSAERLLDLPRDMVVAVGLHPKTKFQSSRSMDDCFRHLRKLVQHDRITAVGEVGLDHSVPMRDWHDQMVHLKKILPLVTTRHVLVLHCRGMSHDNGTEVYMLLLSLVRQGVSQDQRIYLHCFNGDRYVLDQWTTAFPNLYLGFTRLVTSFSPHQSEALRKAEEGRILLETDAPYFSVRGRPWSAPNQLYSVAESVAAVLQMTPERLLEITTANARKLFRQTCRLLHVVLNTVPRVCLVHTATLLDSAPEDAKPFHDIPGPRGIYNIPYLGTMLQFKPFTDIGARDVESLLRTFRDRYGDISKFRMGSDYCVCISSPELCQQALSVTPKFPERFSLPICNAFYERTGEQPGLLLLNGEEWARVRKPTQRLTNRPTSLEPYLPKISIVADDYVETLRKSLVMDDVQQSLYRFTTESVGMLCFNKRLGCLDGGHRLDTIIYGLDIFVEAVEKDLRAIVRPHKYLKLKTPFYRKFEESFLALRNLCKEHVTELIAEFCRLEEEGKLKEYMEKDPNMVFTLLQDRSLDEGTVTTTVTDMFIAGVDSAAKTLSLVLQNLAINPDKQDKLYEELQEAGLTAGQPLTNTVLSSLPYLKACIKESMRLHYPSSGGLLKNLSQDMTIGGYHIPEKTNVLIANAVMVKDARYFDDPEEFIPERWIRTDVSTSQVIKAFSNLPFGHGNRNCVGRRFAEREMQIGIAKLIQNFRVRLPPGCAFVSHDYQTFAAPKGKLTLLLENRVC
ncbi:cytochrome P450 CYP12A2-like [Pecten maximus]|uniref:cytochrome P450 CYP12A2-like n=1 Tax=Pecten maximus TaxID=6579 RepID=UPI001458A72B|nr:cytochrome P450 CYP12A2-like [Pecten maximus]